ncbi:MAG: 6-carboxytetrahydropterin synthase QueD [Thermoanaerobaculia bacterium]
MFILVKEVEFSAAHIIPGHPGVCKNLHGHTYKVKVFVQSERLNHLDMVIDFSELKRIVKEEVKRFDHSYLNELEEFREKTPTAEIIAMFLYENITKRLPVGLKLQKVEVYENDSSYAIYYP